ncbi:MAG: TldD/PmbA family protein, partial [Tannerella sp.]|nr:TldD/PmbA family protein [Tannerella sp.]
AQLFVDGRYGSISTNRLDWSELQRFIRNGIDSIRYLAQDIARSIPDASLYYTGGKPDLQLYDSKISLIQPDDKVALAMRTCDEIMDKDHHVISASASYSDGEMFGYIIASNGFEGETSASCFSLAAEASIKGEGEARPSSWWYETSLYYDELVKTGVGTTALERALRKLGQQKILSAAMPMIVDFANSSRLLSPVINAINGQAIQQKNSFLLDKLGEKVFCSKFTLIDEPHLLRATGARYFDNEGVATSYRKIFDNGTLNTYYIDTYNSNKLKMPQTVGSPSILTMPSGTRTMAEMIGSQEHAVLVTGFNGGNCNPVTGDFSYGIEGMLIENGVITQPLNEMNITGNMLDLWRNLVEIGNDPRLTSAWRIPSLMFDNVNFSGL